MGIEWAEPQRTVGVGGRGGGVATEGLDLRAVQVRLCQAILRDPVRINLDGSPSGEEIDDRSRALAKLRLEESAARQAKKAAKAEQQRLRAAAEASAQPQAPEPATAEIPDEKPEPAAPPAPAKSRKLLVAGSAAMEAALKRRLAGGSLTTEVLKTVPVASSGRR